MLILFIALGVLLVLSLATVLFVLRIFLKTMGRAEAVIPYEDSKIMQRKDLKPHFNEFSEGMKFIDENSDKVFVTAYDGIRLAAFCIPCKNARGTVLLMHGFRSSPYVDFGCAKKKYHSMGLNIVAPYQRAHGLSEGKYLTFGVKERYDVFSWIEFINQRFGGDIFVDGLSMGCATVLMASELGYPENVRGIIADCGYTSPYEIVVSVMKNSMHLPKYPFIWLFNGMCRIFAGFSLSECSAVEAMKKNKTPVLFVHGEADDFVPYSMGKSNHTACIAEKYFLSSKTAGHALCYFEIREEYDKMLESFITSHMSSKEDRK